MTKEQLISSKESESNRIVVNSTNAMVALLSVEWLLNAMGIFILDKAGMSIAMTIAIILCTFPTLLIYVLKLDGPYIKYIIITMIVLMTGTLYVFLSYHAVMAFVYPLMISSLYFNKRISNYATVLSVIVIIGSHTIAPYVTITPDEPLRNFYDSMIYGALPRCVIFLGLAYITRKATNVTSKMLESVIETSKNMEQNKNSVTKILSESHRMLDTHSLTSLAEIIPDAVSNIIGFVFEKSDKVRCAVGLRKLTGEYELVDNCNNKLVKCIKLGDKNFIKIDKEGGEINIPLVDGYDESEMLVEDNYVFMYLYDDFKLQWFIYVDDDIERKDNVLEIMRIMFNTIILDIANIRLDEEMSSTQKEIILSFAEISESKSRQTGQHIKRVSEYMRVFGRRICENDTECNYLCDAAMLHDIGKLLTPEEILEKPGKLTPEEFAVIKKHTSFGSELLKNAPSRVMIIANNIALQHHERWDGTGYAGLKGDEIDYYSRFVSVIDVFDALISKRSYKEAWSIEDAYNEIVSKRGTQFAPEAVDLFEECFDELVEIFRKYPDEKAA